MNRLLLILFHRVTTVKAIMSQVVLIMSLVCTVGTAKAQQDIDWFKWTVPEGETAFEILLQPEGQNVDMEVYRMFRAYSGNWITGIIFPRQFSRPGLIQERYIRNNCSPADTFFIKIFAPDEVIQDDTCRVLYELQINTKNGNY